MIKIENVVTLSPEQWMAVIMGTRNAMNSWEKSDSGWLTKIYQDPNLEEDYPDNIFEIGENDHSLMMKLRNAGTDHRKFMRMITVYVDITAPLYWWKEADTYSVGVVKNSCSTMHKIHEKEFTLEDFSIEHLHKRSIMFFSEIIDILNDWRDIYLNGGMVDNYNGKARIYEKKDKDAWWQMIQLLPSSYNQKRTVMLNYEVLANIYNSRKNHKLDEWVEFCKWIETLPYSELITGKNE